MQNKVKKYDTQPDIELREGNHKMRTMDDNITSEMGWRTDGNNEESVFD